MSMKHNMESPAKERGQFVIVDNRITLQTTMNVFNLLLCALLSTILLLWSPEIQASTITYTYDNAGNLIISSQPTPGLLVSRPSASQIMLFWPAAPAGFVLYSSGSLATGAQWNISGATPFQLGDLNVVTQALGTANTFYRLQK